MKTAGSRKIVDSPDGWQWIVMGNEDGSYTAWRCELVEGRTFARSWQAVEAVQQGTAFPVTAWERASGRRRVVLVWSAGGDDVRRRRCGDAVLRHP